MINYAIVGGGRLARHFSQYFHLLEIPHTRWTRDRRSPFNSFELPDAEQRLRETVGATLHPYLNQVAGNFIQAPEAGQTG